MSSYVYNPDGHVTFIGAKVDIDVRNGVGNLVNSVNGQWVVNINGIQYQVDPATGRIIDPVFGLAGNPVIDPTTGELLNNDLIYSVVRVNRIRGGSGIGSVPRPRIRADDVDAAPFVLGASLGGRRPDTRCDEAPSGPSISTANACCIDNRNEFINSIIRNVTTLGCNTEGSVAISDTDNYKLSMTQIINIIVTGQRSTSNMTGPILAAENYGSFISNGATFELPRTITESYTHCKYDGTYFYIDANSNITVSLPNNADWTGRVFKYKNISRNNRNVVLSNGRNFDGDKCLGTKIKLPPGASIELHNRVGIYYVFSYHTTERGREPEPEPCPKKPSKCETTDTSDVCPPHRKQRERVYDSAQLASPGQRPGVTPRPAKR